jgi:hypothetical protein
MVYAVASRCWSFPATCWLSGSESSYPYIPTSSVYGGIWYSSVSCGISDAVGETDVPGTPVAPRPVPRPCPNRTRRAGARGRTRTGSSFASSPPPSPGGGASQPSDGTCTSPMEELARITRPRPGRGQVRWSLPGRGPPHASATVPPWTTSAAGESPAERVARRRLVLWSRACAEEEGAGLGERPLDRLIPFVDAPGAARGVE